VFHHQEAEASRCNLLTVLVWQNVCGMSVVGQDFEKFKRFNLSEIYQAGNPEQLSRKIEPA
jgi:hypothetical protein